MFLDKVQKICNGYNISNELRQRIAVESLLYSMKLNNRPNTLKKLLTSNSLDSSEVTEKFKGLPYLLHTLPEVLVDKKKKIPVLQDFLFAKSVLNEQHLDQLKERVTKIKGIHTSEIYPSIATLIKKQGNKGTFLSMFDKMFETHKDFQQDVAVEALTVLNTELHKLTSYEADPVQKFFSTCLKGKAATLISKHKKKSVIEKTDSHGNYKSSARTVTIEETHNVSNRDLRSNEGTEDLIFDSYADTEMSHDLQKILSPKVYQGLALFCGFATEHQMYGFEQFIEDSGYSAISIKPSLKKKLIEKYVGEPVFSVLKQNETLKSYLIQ